jgi:hypothetical protein
LSPIAVPFLSNLTELSCISPRKFPLLKRLILTVIAVTVAFGGIANPKPVAFNACEVPLLLIETVALTPLLEVILPGFDHAVPVPLVVPVVGNNGPEVTGAAALHVYEDVSALLAVPWHIVTPVVVGTGLIVMALFEEALTQPVFPVAVNVNVLLPAAMSAGLGL